MRWHGANSSGLARPSALLAGACRRVGGWCTDTWAGEAGRRPLWLSVLFGLGIAVYFLLPAEPPLLLGPTLAGPLLLLLLTGAGSSWQRALAWVGLMVALGFTVGQYRVSSVEAPRLEKPSKSFEAEVCVQTVMRRSSYTQLTVNRFSGEASLPAGLAAHLRWRNAPPDLSAGERLRIFTRLFPVSRPIYPGSYNPRRRAFFEGVGAEGWFGKSTERIGRCEPPGRFETARAWLRDRLLALSPGPSGGILVAVTTGWRGDIPREDTQAMRDAGLGHLLAISGLHVGLAVGLVLVSLRAALALVPYLVLHYPIKKWAAVAGLLAGVGYLLFSGGSVPTQRAMIMLGIVLVALLLDRIELSMRPVAWAAVIVLAITPEAILSPSFQLSFAAVIGLVAGFEAWQRRLYGSVEKRWPWPVRYLVGVAATTVIATLATTPFAAFHFHRFALMGLLANLVAVPVFAFWIMPMLLLGLALAPFGLEGRAWQAAGAGVEVILDIAHGLSGWEGAVAQIGIVPDWSVALMVAGGLWWAIWQQGWRWIGLPVAAVGGLLGSLVGQPPDLILDHRAMAVYDRANGYWVQGKLDFVRSRWLEETATNPLPWPADGETASANGTTLRCQGTVCLIETPEGRARIAGRGSGPIICHDVALAIVRTWPPDCGYYVRYGETLAVRFSDGLANVRSSYAPNRPWMER